MELDKYHDVLVALDQALRVFKDAGANLSRGDQELVWRLEVIRSQVLKAESGHPFPQQTQISPSGSGELETGGSVSEPGLPNATVIEPPKKIRVLLADDHESVRALLRALLEAEGDFDVIADARNGQEAVELATASQPDIIIMDLDMPVLDGVSATREALRVSPDTRVIIFSANQHPTWVQKSLEAGAVGFVPKPANRKTIIAALRAVHRGKTVWQALGTPASA